ncbi:MAG TPA: glycerol-3-phosphate acyltransferase [Acidimicrobiales bacterium]|nr:glycerol-3-phosphate acyltransferase [Acidimicrobiales bacterium]
MPVVLAVSYAAGAIPFSGLAARLTAGTDLRQVGTGTVSGTSLYQVAGFGPLALAGSLDVAKGAVGPLLAGRGRPVLGALAAGAAVAGHNWSPLLGGAGGRGISTALGGTMATAPEATVILGGALGVGRLLHQTGFACFLAILALFPVLARRRGLSGLVLAGALALPMLAKRLTGNQLVPDGPDRRRVLLWRLLFDRDSPKRDGDGDSDGDVGRKTVLSR